MMDQQSPPDILGEILGSPRSKDYLASFAAGQTLFLEGDRSQDLFFLIKGRLAVFKGRKKIFEIEEPGSIFGEMALILEGPRTATVKADTPVEVVRIPKADLDAFFAEFPRTAKVINHALAARLEEANYIVYGFREFCDQMPDAVILTDKEGEIISWNQAAEKLYGRTWDQMRHRSVSTVFQQPAVCDSLLDEVKEAHSIQEQVVAVQHPQKGPIYVSLSLTCLYDGHQNFQGFLLLGRDATAHQKFARKYRRYRYLMVPLLILLCLAGVAFHYGYPYYSKGYQILDERKQAFRELLAGDYRNLAARLGPTLVAGNRKDCRSIMSRYFENASPPRAYLGVVLLKSNKKVLCAHALNEGGTPASPVGVSYAGVELSAGGDYKHHVIDLYRVDPEHPTGRKYTEIAFDLGDSRHFLGWLVFQPDMAVLEDRFAIDKEDLNKMQFLNP